MQARGKAVLFTVIVFAAAGCGSSTIPPASIATTLAAGSAALRQGEYQAAEQLFLQVISRDPHEVAGYYDLGLAYQDQHDTRAALRAYAKAQALNQNFVPVIYNRAVLYAATNPQLALFLYRKVLTIQPDSPTAYLNLGLLEAQQGPVLHKRAEQDLARAVRLEPSLASQIPSALRTGLPHPAASASSSPQS